MGHEDGGNTDGGGPSPSQEIELLESLLRHQVGIDPFRVGQVLDHGVAPGDLIAVLDDLDVDDVELLAIRIFRWLVKPSRRLPIGRTLAQVASTGLEEYVDHPDRTMGSIAAAAADRGARYALWQAAAHAGLACRSWWGTPGWPRLVATFLTVIDDPEHEHWHFMGQGSLRPAEPAEVSDQAELRKAHHVTRVCETSTAGC